MDQVVQRRMLREAAIYAAQVKVKEALADFENVLLHWIIDSRWSDMPQQERARYVTVEFGGGQEYLVTFEYLDDGWCATEILTSVKTIIKLLEVS